MFCFKKDGQGVSIGPWADGTECDNLNDQGWCQRGKCAKKLDPSCTTHISKSNNPKTEKPQIPTQLSESVNGTSAAAVAANSIFLDLNTVWCTIVMIINCAKLVYYYY